MLPRYPVHRIHKGTILKAILLVCLFAIPAVCPADFATPFVEINNQAGEVSESFGYLASMNPDRF